MVVTRVGCFWGLLGDFLSYRKQPGHCSSSSTISDFQPVLGYESPKCWMTERVKSNLIRQDSAAGDEHIDKVVNDLVALNTPGHSYRNPVDPSLESDTLCA